MERMERIGGTDEMRYLFQRDAHKMGLRAVFWSVGTAERQNLRIYTIEIFFLKKNFLYIFSDILPFCRSNGKKRAVKP